MQNLQEIDFSNIFLTSRSACEQEQRCPFARHLRYLYKGIGVVPVPRHIPLTTGTATHKGVQLILTKIKKTQSLPEDERELEGIIEYGIEGALDEYGSIVRTSGLMGKGTETEESQRWTIAEQRALTEGLVRAWSLRELPQLVKRFRILDVEREELEWLIEGEILFQGKVDAILRDRESDEIYAYSLKTIKEWDWRSEKNYKVDLQGITEIWMIEERLKREQDKRKEIIRELEKISGVKKKKAILDLLKSSNLSTRCSGVKFCFLQKGNRVEEKGIDGKGTGFWRTYSPLIRGYRKINPSDIQYAHSWFTINPNNKSGKGILGKGWEPFNVWEEGEWKKGGVKKQLGVKWWMGMLDQGEIQPELGDVIKGQVVTPEEYFRREEEIGWQIEELRNQEQGVKLRSEEGYKPRHYRHSCYYPTDCDYVQICHQGKEIETLLENGEFEWRVPHHEMELKQIGERRKELEEKGDIRKGDLEE